MLTERRRLGSLAVAAKMAQNFLTEPGGKRIAYPDPEAVRLTKLADQIAKRTD